MPDLKTGIEKIARANLVLALLLWSGLSFIFATASAAAGIQIQSQESRGLIIGFQPQNWHTQSLAVDGKNYTIYCFDDAGHYDRMGDPMVPVMTIVIGIPLQGDVNVKVVGSDFTVETSDIPPVPTFSEQESDVGLAFLTNTKTFQSADFFPDEIVQMETPAFFRDQRIIRLHIFPLQYQPSSKIVRKYHSIRLQVDFSASETAPIGASYSGKNEALYQEVIVNYEQAKFWRKRDPIKTLKSRSSLNSGTWYRFKINKEGIYKITGKALAEHGLSLNGIHPDFIRLFNNGGRELPRKIADSQATGLLENAISIVGGQDGRIDLDDYLLFYGIPNEGWQYEPATKQYRHYRNRYNADNKYFLCFSDQPGKRMAESGLPPVADISPEPYFEERLFWEEELVNPIASGMDWVGRPFDSERKEQTYQFTLNNAHTNVAAMLVLRLAAASPGSQVFQVFFNNHLIDAGTLTGMKNYFPFKEFRYPIPSLLREGNNEIKISFQAIVGLFRAYTDWLELYYPRKMIANDRIFINAPMKEGPAHYQITGFRAADALLFDVSDPLSVKQIKMVTVRQDTLSFFDSADPKQSNRYAVISAAQVPVISALEKLSTVDLISPRSAEFIIITHDDFINQAQQLKSLHEDWRAIDRLKTEVVNVKDIYNEFSNGMVDPAAIRNFIRHAFLKWRSGTEAELRYVLLFGDGDYDFKNYATIADKNWLPPYQESHDYIYSSLTTDDWFVDVDGNQIPDIAVGRLPVQSPADASNAIEKIIQYETRPTPGAWQTQITLLADDLISDRSDAEIEHTRDSEKLAQNYIPGAFEQSKIYLINYSGESNPAFSGIYKPGANTDLIKQLNAGTLILNFLGHGNTRLLTHERVLNEPTDFAKIQNAGMLPLVFAGTCDFGLWDDPLEQSFSEKLILAPNRGVIALVSPTRKAEPIANADFNFKLYESLFRNFQRDGRVNTIGDAVLSAKIRQYASENSRKFALLGLPTLRIAAPGHQVSFESIEPDTIMALRKLRVRGKILKNGQTNNEFQGKILVRVNDSEKNRELKYSNPGWEQVLKYRMPGNTVYRGYATVTNGQFQLSLIVPKDISYGGVRGRISGYAWNPENACAVGFVDGLAVGGTAKDLIDTDGPEIVIGFEGQNFRPGDYVEPNPVLKVAITDSITGVNIAGAIGHQIEMILDHDARQKKILNDYFRYFENDCYRGEICYPLADLDPGRHFLSIKAWDNANNAASAEIEFISVGASEFALQNLLNYPNPMAAQTQFTFEWLGPDAEISLKIYTVAGRLIRVFPAYRIDAIGFNVFPEPWDGRDQDGDLVANGLYIYRLEANSFDAGQRQQTEALGRLVIVR